ncbi:MAG: hypothetical protein CVU42_00270 [Chloroflexi bacterium HGW-Chloroflexi-4]|jgi:hypothetical protein|nr:MAG: hypothetical protein CVU42_00270 [Chloroflexi bacterium HGW-Chloroflexi-4]
MTISYMPTLNKIDELLEIDWCILSEYLNTLSRVVGNNPHSSSSRLIESRELLKPLGYDFSIEQHEAFLKVMHSNYGEHLYCVFKKRSTFFLIRLLRTLERFPSTKIDKSEIIGWQNCLNGLLRDMDALLDSSEMLKEVEHFAASTLSLSRFIITWHDPELVTSLYLLELSEKEGHGLNFKTERYLIELAKKEMEMLMNPSSFTIFNELLDDEANIWWGIFKLFYWEKNSFSIHEFRGVDGFLEIMDKLLLRKTIIFPQGDTAKKELTFEIHGEYKSILNITGTAFMIADMLDDLKIKEYPERIRAHVLGLLNPFLIGQKSRNNNIYTTSLETETWGRITAFNKNKRMLDFQGRIIPSSYYLNQFK